MLNSDLATELGQLTAAARCGAFSLWHLWTRRVGNSVAFESVDGDETTGDLETRRGPDAVSARCRKGRVELHRVGRPCREGPHGCGGRSERDGVKPVNRPSDRCGITGVLELCVGDRRGRGHIPLNLDLDHADARRCTVEFDSTAAVGCARVEVARPGGDAVRDHSSRRGSDVAVAACSQLGGERDFLAARRTGQRNAGMYRTIRYLCAAGDPVATGFADAMPGVITTNTPAGTTMAAPTKRRLRNMLGSFLLGDRRLEEVHRPPLADRSGGLLGGQPH